MANTMRARYDLPTGEVQIFMSLIEFEALVKELNHPKVRNELRTVGIQGEFFRVMCDSLIAAISRASSAAHGSLTTIMTGWWYTPH